MRDYLKSKMLVSESVNLIMKNIPPFILFQPELDLLFLRNAKGNRKMYQQSFHGEIKNLELWWDFLFI